MRRLAVFGARLSAGPLVGVAIYAVLRAVAPASAKPDPWVAHFRAQGLNARLRSVSRAPGDHFAIIEERDSMKEPEMARTVLRVIEIDRTDVQIAEFETAELAAEIVARAGRSKRRKSGQLYYQLHRAGRHIAIVAPVNLGILGVRRFENVAPELVDRLLGAFASRAENLP